jgi:hypothetical protein
MCCDVSLYCAQVSQKNVCTVRTSTTTYTVCVILLSFVFIYVHIDSVFYAKEGPFNLVRTFSLLV